VTTPVKSQRNGPALPAVTLRHQPTSTPSPNSSAAFQQHFRYILERPFAHSITAIDSSNLAVVRRRLPLKHNVGFGRQKT